jgi:hypothetical protein
LYPPKIEDGADDPSVMPDERVKFDEATEWAAVGIGGNGGDGTYCSSFHIPANIACAAIIVPSKD